MATNIIRELFFAGPLDEIWWNFKNSKIFNNIGSHDGLRKKNNKIGQNAANPTFFYSPCIYKEKESRKKSSSTNGQAIKGH